MKRIIVLSILGIVCASTVFIGSFVTSDNRKYNNDFVRVFPPHAADIRHVSEIRTRSYVPVGISNQRLYLQDRFGLLKVDLINYDTTQIRMSIPFGSEVVVDSVYYFVLNGGTPTVQRGGVKTWQLDTTFTNVPGFLASRPLSRNNVAFRTIDISKRESALTNTVGQTYPLQKQVDGLFCTEGFLQYSEELCQIVYTYRYRNQFICLDSNLNVIRIGKTIDTTSVAKIEVTEQDGKITMSKPPLSVNKGAYVDGKYLFIRSNLAAKNETTEEFNKRSVIDVYNLLDGSYRFSFYIDNHEGLKMRDFVVKDNTLVSIFKGYVIIHYIPAKYLP